jgi:hypothetical protein
METFLLWLAALEGAQGVARLTGLPRLARWWLRRRGGVVKAAGFQFFPDRPSLHLAHGNLARRFANVSSVDAIWVVGQGFYHAGENLTVVKRLLLPNPDDEGFRYLSNTVGAPLTSDWVKEVTGRAKKSGAKVRWYNNFIFNSIILADVDKPSGWMHIETVLPYSKTTKRPSYTVYKVQSEETVLEMKRIFQEIWDAASDPTI